MAELFHGVVALTGLARFPDGCCRRRTGPSTLAITGADAWTTAQAVVRGGMPVLETLGGVSVNLLRTRPVP